MSTLGYYLSSAENLLILIAIVGFIFVIDSYDKRKKTDLWQMFLATLDTYCKEYKRGYDTAKNMKGE